MKIRTKEVEEAIKTLLKWIGEDPAREGLRATPSRVAERYKQIFSGYSADLEAILNKPAIKIEKDMGMVIVPGIKFISFCEHHFLPMIGEIDIAYLPSKQIAGLGTIVKIANSFTRRLQLQEQLTEQIADAIDQYLKPKGVAVSIRANHYCTDRSETGSISEKLYTYKFSGLFETDKDAQNQFLSAIKGKQ
jgi:GTP cyclohydrolase I